MSTPAEPPRLRICVTGLRGIPGVMGGVETHCEELLPRVAKIDPGLDIEVLARRPYVRMKRNVVGGIVVTSLPSPKTQSFEALVSTVVGIIHARRRRADLIHIHAIGPALAAPLAKILGMRIVFTHHGEDYRRAKWGRIARLMLRLGEQWGVRMADAVIVVSNSLTEELKQRFPKDAAKIRYVPNGAPTLGEDGEAGPVLAQFDLRPRAYILAVARLVPEKGLHILIDALRKSGDRRKLLIVGGADHETPYSRALLTMADDQVIFAGAQPRPTLSHLYANASLFVLPSFHEGLPIVALEAGLAGCAMLLSDITPNLDVGLPSRHYFKSGSVEALAEALQRPSSDYLVDQEFFRSRFAWNEIAQTTRAIYRKVAGARRGKAG